MLVALLTAHPLRAGPSGRSSSGLSPADEERYRRATQLFASLDGIHQHRIPTLVAAHSRVPGPRMIVAVYQQGEESEVALGSQEGFDLRVDRVADLGRDGRRYLVVRVGSDEGASTATWLSIFTVVKGRLVRVAPVDTIHEVRDVDGDGVFEGLSLSTKLDGFAGLPRSHSPRVVQVWALRAGRFVNADRDYLRYHWRRLEELRRMLERPVAGPPTTEQVGWAVSLYFEHEILGQPEDGLTIASHYLSWVRREGDRLARRCAERALAALGSRVRRTAPTHGSGPR